MKNCQKHIHCFGVFKTMTSSGTTGQAVSKIFVDKETAMIQQKVMIKNKEALLVFRDEIEELLNR